MEYITGILKDIYDSRDHISSSVNMVRGVVKGTYPPVLDLRPNLPNVRNQGPRGTCGAFAGSVIKDWHEHMDSGYRGYMSPEFIYFHRPNKPRHGMYSRDVMTILLHKGCCSEKDLPYQSTDPESIPENVNESAKKYCIKEYARVLTIDDLKMALYQNGPCYISFPMYNELTEFWRPVNNEKVQGGHAVAVVGYNKNGFILRNSWGIFYGNNGHAIYPYEDFGLHWDIWTAIDVKGSPKPPYQNYNCDCCNIV
jgi:hypothetical protein